MLRVLYVYIGTSSNLLDIDIAHVYAIHIAKRHICLIAVLLYICLIIDDIAAYGAE